MKTLILLVGIALAVAGKTGKPKKENEFVVPATHYTEFIAESDVVEKQENEFVIPEKQYPEVITEFDVVDYSQLSIEQLIQIASEHEGLEFLSDVNATAAMGIDISTLSKDLLADATATTVRYIWENIFSVNN